MVTYIITAEEVNTFAWKNSNRPRTARHTATNYLTHTSYRWYMYRYYPKSVSPNLSLTHDVASSKSINSVVIV